MTNDFEHQLFYKYFCVSLIILKKIKYILILIFIPLSFFYPVRRIKIMKYIQFRVK